MLHKIQHFDILWADKMQVGLKHCHGESIAISFFSDVSLNSCEPLWCSYNYFLFFYLFLK